MPNYEIASDKEWEDAKKKFETIENKRSGYKLRKGRANSPPHHSFLYLKDKDKSKTTIVCIPNHYYLGKGGFARAKIVEDEEGNLYVLKIQKNTISQNEKKCLEKMGYLKFVGERFGDPKSYYKYGQQKWILPRTSYILQEYFPGITLEDYIASNPGMTEQQQNTLFQLVIKAVQEIHDENIVHSDLKPKNIILYNDSNNQLQIRVIDFGGSIILKDEETSREVHNPVSTKGYSAPEANKSDGTGTLSKASDIYSLGVIAKDNIKLNTPIIKKMCANAPHERPSLDELKNPVECDFTILPKVDATELLKAKYQVLLDCLLKHQKEKLIKALNYQMGQTDIYNVKIDNLEKIQKIPLKSDKLKNWEKGNFGEKFQIGKMQAKVLSPDEIVNEKYKGFKVLHASENIINVSKSFLLEELSTLVRSTNNIESLDNFFKYLKNSERDFPILRKERGFFMKMFGNSGRTNTWKKVVDIFKNRAFELAQNEANLKSVILNPDKYKNILQEKSARILESKSIPLKEFESLIKKTNKM